MDLFDTYPFRPGSKGSSGTSEAAAKAMAPKAPTLRARCLAEVVGAGAIGRTADEVADRLRHDKCSIRPRLSELLRLGKVRDSGLRRKTAMGAAAVVWIAEEGAGA